LGEREGSSRMGPELNSALNPTYSKSFGLGPQILTSKIKLFVTNRTIINEKKRV
jgi:hypothetical protein